MGTKVGIILIAATIMLSCGQVKIVSRKSHDGWHNSLKPKGRKGAKLTLVKNGKSDYRIVIPQKATSQDRKAAKELQNWLEKISEAELMIVTEQEHPDSEKIISVGLTRALMESGLKALNDDLGDEGYGIATKGKILFLWGGRTRGSINAVFALLEEDLGCRWYSDKHERIPKIRTLKLAPVVRTYKPALKIRDPFYHVSFNAEWSLRNRTNARGAGVREEWGGRVDYGGRFVHTFHTLLPPNKYFKEHPEYYMVDKNGKRDPFQLCTTNPEVVRLVTEEVKRFLNEHPNTEIVSVSKTDGGRSCLCKNCKTLDDKEGTNMAALLYLVNKVAEAIEKEHPHVLVSTLAYLETVGVPKTMRPRKNVAIRLCNDGVGSWVQPFTPGEQCRFGELVKAWSAVHDRIYIWDYVVNFSHYMAPMPNIEVVAKNIRFLVENNAEGIMTQGAYQSTGAEREWLRSWVTAKLMWDPSRDLNKLLKDFIIGHYGKAAPAIEDYNKLLRKQGEKFKDVLTRPEGGIRYNMDNPFLSKVFLDKAAMIFDRAEKMAESEDVLHRIESERLPVMYVKLMRGPEFVGKEYGKALERFEKIAHREGVTHLREGGPDLDEKLQKWQNEWQEYLAGKSEK